MSKNWKVEYLSPLSMGAGVGLLVLAIAIVYAFATSSEAVFRGLTAVLTVVVAAAATASAFAAVAAMRLARNATQEAAKSAEAATRQAGLLQDQLEKTMRPYVGFYIPTPHKSAPEASSAPTGWSVKVENFGAVPAVLESVSGKVYVNIGEEYKTLGIRKDTDEEAHYLARPLTLMPGQAENIIVGLSSKLMRALNDGGNLTLDMDYHRPGDDATYRISEQFGYRRHGTWVVEGGKST